MCPLCGHIVGDDAHIVPKKIKAPLVFIKGEVASAAGGGSSEQMQAPWSKVACAPSRQKLLGTTRGFL